jgi:hypothetical protein
MKRREDFPLMKVTLNLYDGDFQQLQSLYPRLGASKVIRVLVHSHLKEIHSKAVNRIKEEEAA